MSIDLMSSHQDHHVNDEFYKWLDKKYGRVGKVAGHHGNIHDYLDVYYKYYADMFILDMTDYSKKMVEEEFPVKLGPKGRAGTPASDIIFNTSERKPRDLPVPFLPISEVD